MRFGRRDEDADPPAMASSRPAEDRREGRPALADEAEAAYGVALFDELVDGVVDLGLGELVEVEALDDRRGSRR
jgi:hypothetical protein